MLDRHFLALGAPLLNHLARKLVARGIKADHVTFTAFALGLLASLMIGLNHSLLALAPLLLSRLLDGLDGAVARQSSVSDRGAFLDITFDFLFYASVPLAFAWADPVRHALPAANLLAAFAGTGASFLAFAIIAAKRGESSAVYPAKSFYYLGGLTEGSETILCFVAMCLWPQFFPLLAYVYGVLCAVTILTRLTAGYRFFSS